MDIKIIFSNWNVTRYSARSGLHVIQRDATNYIGLWHDEIPGHIVRSIRSVFNWEEDEAVIGYIVHFEKK